MTTTPMHVDGVSIAQAIDGAVADGVGSVQAITKSATSAYTLAQSDVGGTVIITDASAVAVTIPATATVDIPVGSVIYLVNMGVGKVTPTAAANVTLDHGAAVAGVIMDQFAVVRLQKIVADTWVLSGGGSAS